MIEQLLLLLTDPSGLCRFTVEGSLVRLGIRAVEPILAFLRKHEGRALAPVLEVALNVPDPHFLEPALKLSHDSSPTVRSAAAALLGVLGGDDAVISLQNLLVDTDSDVRAAAAKSLGKLRHWPVAPLLSKALRDRAWTVRREAGLALRSMGSPGLLCLRRSRTDSDAFAADMARQVLDLVEAGERPTS